MYRLLIVDDEPDIVDGLYMVFKDHEFLDLDIYKSYSAHEALDYLSKSRIDIVLTDICMPQMSGLKMMEIIKENWPECRIIFLTGHNEFDYIYSAVKGNAIKYLLKTENRETIVETVNETLRQIKKSHEIDDLIEISRKKIEQSIHLIQKEYLIDIINGNTTTSDEMAVQFKDLNISLDPHEQVLLMIARIDNQTDLSVYRQQVEIFESIRLIVDKYLNKSMSSMFFDYYRNYLIWLIQPLSGNDLSCESIQMTVEAFQTFLRGTIESIQEICFESMHTSLSFAIDNSLTSWSELPVRFEVLRKAMHGRLGVSTGMQLIFGDMIDEGSQPTGSEHNSSNEMRVLIKQIRSMEFFLESGQRKAFNTIMEQFIHYLLSIEQLSFKPAIEAYYSLALMFLSYINLWNLTEIIIQRVSLDPLTNVGVHLSWKDAVIYLINLSDIIFDEQNQNIDGKATLAITKIQKHILDNLRDDPSLNDLAELVHFNPSYLSRLYKQMTGITLQSYIDDVKISKAKDYLRDDKKKINEISSDLGFISAHYFSKFFKRHMNVSPQQYRDSFLNK